MRQLTVSSTFYMFRISGEGVVYVPSRWGCQLTAVAVLPTISSVTTRLAMYLSGDADAKFDHVIPWTMRSHALIKAVATTPQRLRSQHLTENRFFLASHTTGLWPQLLTVSAAGGLSLDHSEAMTTISNKQRRLWLKPTHYQAMAKTTYREGWLCLSPPTASIWP